jgi:DNA-directed RNA polymerase subunit omega
MARITVEDCVEVESNRFKLILCASKRAREISAGALVTVARDNDKNPVIALREIAEGTVSIETIEESIIKNMQRHFIRDEAEPDLDGEIDILSWQGESDTGSASDPEALALAHVDAYATGSVVESEEEEVDAFEDDDDDEEESATEEDSL